MHFVVLSRYGSHLIYINHSYIFSKLSVKIVNKCVCILSNGKPPVFLCSALVLQRHILQAAQPNRGGYGDHGNYPRVDSGLTDSSA